MAAGLIILVAWGALAFGAVYPWAYYPLLLAAIAYGLSGLLHGSHEISRGLPIAIVALTLGVAVQTVPLPASMLARISPAADPFLRQHDLAYAFAAETGDRAATRHAISLSPDATLRSVLFLAAFGLLLIGLAKSLRTAAIQSFAGYLAILGAVVALIGIVQRATVTTNKIYGFWTPYQVRAPFGPFVNRNHFAGWMLMALGMTIGLCFAQVAVARRDGKPGWRRRIAWLSSAEANRLMLGAFAVVLMGLALVLSLSRSGITCLAAAIALAAAAAARGQSSLAKRITTGGYLAFVLLVAVGWAGVDQVAKRFAAASWDDLGLRLGAWRDGIRIVQDFPVAGIGINAFGDAMLRYQTTHLEWHFGAAHNDWLQLAAEGGVLVGLLMCAVLFFFVREIVRRFREHHGDEMSYWIRAGAVIGLIAIALQELVEFSLQIPGNAVLFTILAAIAIHKPAAAPDRRRRHEHLRTVREVAR